MKYTYKDFEKLISCVEDSYEGVSIDKIHENLIEVFFEIGVPFARLIYDENSSKIIVSLNAQTRPNDAVFFMLELIKNWEHISIAPNFYVDTSDHIYVGADAENQMFIDIEEQIILAFLQESGAEDVVLELYAKSRHRPNVFMSKLEALEFMLKMKGTDIADYH